MRKRPSRIEYRLISKSARRIPRPFIQRAVDQTISMAEQTVEWRIGRGVDVYFEFIGQVYMLSLDYEPTQYLAVVGLPEDMGDVVKNAVPDGCHRFCPPGTAR